MLENLDQISAAHQSLLASALYEKLLAARQPYLCQRCHLNTRHPGTLYDGTNTLAGRSVTNRAVEHACKNCHQNVHGGNAPSGPYLGR